MMKRLAVLFSLLVSGSSCVSQREVPFAGIIYSNQHFDGTVSRRTDVQPRLSERGCLRMYLGLVAVGQAGAGELASRKGMERIAWIDHDFFNVLGLYTAYCTVVYGE